MRYIKTEAIVIKRRNYNEADRLLTVFTKDHGKMQIKAKGVRRITSKRSSHIELLNHSRLSLYKAHSVPVLTEIETLEQFDEIKNDLYKVGFAYHVCELIDGLCPENQENTLVFDLLSSTLHRLSRCYSDIGTDDDPMQQETLLEVVHGFEVELLTLLGYWNNTTTTSNIGTHNFIESILERRLRSKKIFSKMS
jgi:DNA repair protein RecO (recombination protein O)